MNASSSQASVFTVDSRWFPPRYRGRGHRHALDRNRRALEARITLLAAEIEDDRGRDGAAGPGRRAP